MSKAFGWEEEEWEGEELGHIAEPEHSTRP